MTGHVNPFANDYSFEAKTAKLPKIFFGPMDVVNWATGGLYENDQSIRNQQINKIPGTTYGPPPSNINPATGGVWGDNYNVPRPVNTTPTNWQNAGQQPTPTNTPTTPNTEDMQDQLRNEISSAWDAFTGSLGRIGSEFLPQQRTAQEGIAQEQLAAGQKTIGTQKAASLRDIGSNIRNSFQAGNIYLGNRGAGDSSAANQYSFAIQQEAAKQGSLLNEFVDTQLNTLQSQFSTQMGQIANWFSEKQMEVQNMIANGQLNKAQDINSLSMNILNNALQAKAQLEANAQTRYNALLEWAGNNSTNLQQLGANIRGIPQAMGNVQVDASGNIAQQPWGGTVAKKKNPFQAST